MSQQDLTAKEPRPAPEAQKILATKKPKPTLSSTASTNDQNAQVSPQTQAAKAQTNPPPTNTIASSTLEGTPTSEAPGTNQFLVAAQRLDNKKPNKPIPAEQFLKETAPAEDEESDEEEIETFKPYNEVGDDTLNKISDGDYVNKLCNTLFNQGFKLVINTETAGEWMGVKGEAIRKRINRLGDRDGSHFICPTVSKKVPDVVLLKRDGTFHDIPVTDGYLHKKNTTIDQDTPNAVTKPAIRKVIVPAPILPPKKRKAPKKQKAPKKRKLGE
ncbi:hypothetical protein LTR64_005032 [Lithohypha guttulata]|uniref:uncharacterized protein n=1 Tax=Lithohypha guttulata TaxID=1690604 RepID=UPI00315DA46E